jgi:hypothetical protein
MDPCHIGVRHGLTSHPSLRPCALGGQNLPNEGHSSQCASPRHSFALSVTVKKTPNRQKTTVQTDCRHVTARRPPWGNRTPNPTFMRSLVVGTSVCYQLRARHGCGRVSEVCQIHDSFPGELAFCQKERQEKVAPNWTRQPYRSDALAGSHDETSSASLRKPDPSQCAQNQRDR